MVNCSSPSPSRSRSRSRSISPRDNLRRRRPPWSPHRRHSSERHRDNHVDYNDRERDRNHHQQPIKNAQPSTSPPKDNFDPHSIQPNQSPPRYTNFRNTQDEGRRRNNFHHPSPSMREQRECSNDGKWHRDRWNEENHRMIHSRSRSRSRSGGGARNSPRRGRKRKGAGSRSRS